MVDNTEVNWVENYIVRGVLGRALDLLVYWLLGLVYQIFFNVASAELFTNETVKNPLERRKKQMCLTYFNTG